MEDLVRLTGCVVAVGSPSLSGSTSSTSSVFSPLPVLFSSQQRVAVIIHNSFWPNSSLSEVDAYSRPGEIHL